MVTVTSPGENHMVSKRHIGSSAFTTQKCKREPNEVLPTLIETLLLRAHEHEERAVTSRRVDTNKLLHSSEPLELELSCTFWLAQGCIDQDKKTSSEL